MPKKITIGITDCPGYANYERWLADSSIEIVKLASVDGAAAEKSDAIVLSGGGDIHPQRYNRPELWHRLDSKAVDEARDELEWKLVERALAARKPILGICRGMQLMNVFLGGSLIHDIPEVLNLNTHGSIKSGAKGGAVKRRDQRHPVTIRKGSILSSICPALTGEVNSSHHQCIEEISEQLVKSASAEPEVIEALEWKNPEGQSWFLGVEWHPERMPDQDNPLAGGVRAAFLAALRAA